MSVTCWHCLPFMQCPLVAKTNVGPVLGEKLTIFGNFRAIRNLLQSFLIVLGKFSLFQVAKW